MPDIFEKIISREIPAEIIYEDDMVISFLDISPVNKGHALVVPKKKFVNIFDGDPNTLRHMIVIAQKIATSIRKGLGADGVNIVMNNEAAAGQKIFHAHMHIIPRFIGDEAYHAARHTQYELDEIENIGEKLRTALT